MTLEKERIEWIDITKGIGILCVIAGHIFMSDTFIYKAVYLFHMPLFFLISGYLYKVRPIKDYTIRKARSLMIPYFAVFILLYPFLAAFLFSYPINMDQVISDITSYIIGGQLITWRMEHAFGTMWFISCLFLTQIVYNIICNIFSDKATHFIVCISLILAYINYVFFYHFHLFWCANVILAAIPFFHIGQIIKRQKFDFMKFAIPIIILAVAAIISTLYLDRNKFDMAVNFYGIIIFTFVCSITCILAVMCISCILAEYKISREPLRYLGQASLMIMVFHTPIYLLLWKYFQLSSPYAIILIIAIPCIIYSVFNKFKITQFLFLGKN